MEVSPGHRFLDVAMATRCYNVLKGLANIPKKNTTSAEKYKPAAFISIELLKNALPLSKMIAAAYRNIIP